MTRILVTGGRDYEDVGAIYTTLSAIHAETPITLLINGGATGADAISKVWAAGRRVAIKIYRADWQKHGKSAGPIRNQRMLDEGKPDLVVAFFGGRGTADMVRRAEAAGVEVRRV